MIHKESEKNKAGRSSQKAPFPSSTGNYFFQSPGASASQTVPKVNEAGGTRTNEDEATKATGCFFPIPSLSPPIVESTKLIRDRALVSRVLMTEWLCGISSSSKQSENEESLDAGLMGLKWPPSEL